MLENQLIFNFVKLELVPNRDKKKIQATPTNRILVPLRGFRRAPPSFLYVNPPPGMRGA